MSAVGGVRIENHPQYGDCLELSGYKNRHLEYGKVYFKWQDIVEYFRMMVERELSNKSPQYKDRMVREFIDIFFALLSDDNDMRESNVSRDGWSHIDKIKLYSNLLSKRAFGFLSNIYHEGYSYVMDTTTPHFTTISETANSVELVDDVLKEIMTVSLDPRSFSKMNIISKNMMSKKIAYEKYLDALPYQVFCKALKEYHDKKADGIHLTNLDVQSRLMLIWRAIALGVNIYTPSYTHNSYKNRTSVYESIIKYLDVEICNIFVYEYINLVDNEELRNFLETLAHYGRLDLVAYYIESGILSHEVKEYIKDIVKVSNFLYGPIPNYFIEMYEKILPDSNNNNKHPTLDDHVYHEYLNQGLYTMIKTGNFTIWSIPMILDAIDKGYVKTPIDIKTVSNITVYPFFNTLTAEQKDKIYSHSDKHPLWRSLLHQEYHPLEDLKHYSGLVDILHLNGYDDTEEIEPIWDEEFLDDNLYIMEIEEGIYGSLGNYGPTLSVSHDGSYSILSDANLDLSDYIFKYLTMLPSDVDTNIFSNDGNNSILIKILLSYYSPDYTFDHYVEVLKKVTNDISRYAKKRTYYNEYARTREDDLSLVPYLSHRW